MNYLVRLKFRRKKITKIKKAFNIEEALERIRDPHITLQIDGLSALIGVSELQPLPLGTGVGVLAPQPVPQGQKQQTELPSH